MISPFSLISTFGAAGNVTAWLVSKCDAGINSNGHTVFVERRAVHNLAAILDELLTELFSEGVVLPEGWIAGIDTILHELVEVGSARLRISMQRAVISRSMVVSFPCMISYHISRESCRAQFQEESNRWALRASKVGRILST